MQDAKQMKRGIQVLVEMDINQKSPRASLRCE